MQINAIIHDLRIKQGLTQEQMANHLGVSTPAVNKWEKGVTYPDITLLPSLARLLDTDLNTLLSFQEDLSDKEISMFSEKIVTEAKEHGFPIAYNMAFEKIREYPTCDNLILQTALTLQGIFSMYPDIRKNDDFKKDDFDAAIEGLYVRVSTSKSPTVCETAKSMLISTYMQRGEYEKAKVMIESLPDRTTVDKKNLEASLLLRLEDYDNSAVLIEQRLLQETALIYTDLMHLMNIAIKKDQPSKASYLADVTKQFTFLFDLWEYNAYVAEFELAMYQRDPSACIMVLEKLLPALLKNWNYSKSMLYEHLTPKVDQEIPKTNQEIGTQLLQNILMALNDTTNLEFSFLHDSVEFKALLASFQPTQTKTTNRLDS